MNIALVLSGGTGSRLGGDIPKQYMEIGGKPIIAYCLETLEAHPNIDAVRVVAAKEWYGLIRQWITTKLQGFSEPGQTRQLSIWNGLQDIMCCEAAHRVSLTEEECFDIEKPCLDKQDVIVLIHDAARPFVSAETITACLEGCAEHDGAMPALPVKDTVYYGTDGRIESLLDRSKIIAGQAPEAFQLEKYYEANRMLLPDEILKINGSTEPAILAGLDVQYIPGDERNFKITTQEDLERFREIVSGNCRRDK